MTEFNAYPMRLTSPTGKRLRVLSKEEHDALLEQWTEPAPTAAPSVATSVEPPAVMIVDDEAGTKNAGK